MLAALDMVRGSAHGKHRDGEGSSDVGEQLHDFLLGLRGRSSMLYGEQYRRVTS